MNFNSLKETVADTGNCLSGDVFLIKRMAGKIDQCEI
jgi:hypothetical protein